MDGAQIRQLREQRGWTQEQLAEAAGVGPKTIGNWERGRTVPLNKAGRLQEVFADQLRDASADPIRAASEFTLLSELLRRAAERRQAATG